MGPYQLQTGDDLSVIAVGMTLEEVEAANPNMPIKNWWREAIKWNEAGAVVWITTGGDLKVDGLYVADGTALAPSLAFTSDTDTGMYRDGADSISVATGGVQRLDIDGGGIKGKVVFAAPYGSAVAPGFSFDGDSDTGMYRQVADEIGFATGGTENMRLTGANVRLTGGTSRVYNAGSFSGVDATGTALTPTFTWDGDPNTGMYLQAADEIGFSTAGTTLFRMDPDFLRGNVDYTPSMSGKTAGSAAFPAYAFVNDTNTGMYRKSADEIAFATGGTERMAISNTKTVIDSTSTQALIVETSGTNGPYIDLKENGTRTGFIGFPASTAFYLENSRAGGFYRMPQMGALTTSSAANVFFNTSNSSMYRSTSSLRYKTDVEDLGLASAMKALELRPIWYRSLGDDRKDWSFYGLGAEEVAEVDPRLVEFAPTPDCECSLNLVSNPIAEDGKPFRVDDRNLEDHTDDCLKPLNVQYSRLVPHLIRIAQDQRDQLIEIKATVTNLQDRLAVLEGAK